ncbi:MAG: aspartate 1-decarboxylase [Kiritimatiellae bacterium]|nr:aspartate 1-decarboxylase [Kiritimatiellia bacterium]
MFRADERSHGGCHADRTVWRHDGSLSVETLKREQVHVLNVNNGDRIVTYAIEAPAGSGTVSLRGAAARTGQVGDTVIVLTYAVVLGAECAAFKSQTVYVDTQNRRVVPQRGQPVLEGEG